MTLFIPAPAASRTGPLPYLSGGFKYGDAAVPYYSVSMTVQDIVSNVKLPNEIPFNMDKPVEIEELFQRERDELRSKRDIARYLKSPADLKFFNSITVALFPLEKNGESNKFQIASTYDDTSYFGDKPPGLNSESIGVGQISLYPYPHDKSQGFISWDDERTLPVVLDGQHRLASLKHVISSNELFPDKHALEHSRLSVLILVLDPRAGYRDPQTRSVMAACRTVFTDLNKYAKAVSRAREYLLDEGDVRASALRAILAKGVSTSPQGSVVERARAEHRLPLALVDWRGEIAKFDKGPYVSTILALYPVVEATIGIRTPTVDDYEELPGYVGRLTSRLLDGSEAVEMKNTLLERIERSAPQEIPFALTQEEVKRLADGFRRKFGERIVRVLTEFKPYQTLIQEYSDSGYYNTALEAWFSLDRYARGALIDELDTTDPSIGIESISARVKGWDNSKSSDLSFQVVFQRAVISVCDLFLTFRDPIASELDLDLDTDSVTIDEFIARANSRLAPGLRLGAGVTTLSPFLGAGIRPDGTVDFRKTRTAGIAGFMIYALLAPSEVFAGQIPLEERRDLAEKWITEKWQHISRGPKVGIDKLYSSQGSLWRRGLLDVTTAREVEGDEVETAMLEIAVTQLTGLSEASS